MPKVSIIMGVYNGEKKVGNCIDSILNQSFADFEFIICDDCSSDNTVAIINSFAKIDSRIKVLQNSKNKQLAYSLNRCLNVSKGEYIARIDDDDISLPHRLEKQVKFLDENLEYDIVGAKANLYDEKGIYGIKGYVGEITPKEILVGKSFIHPTVMIRKNRIMEVLGYTDRKNTLRTEDLDLWFKLYLDGCRGYVLNEVLINYYESSSSMKKRKYKYRINEYKIRKKIFKCLNLPNKLFIYVYKPILVGLVPKYFIKLLHSTKIKGNIMNDL